MSMWLYNVQCQVYNVKLDNRIKGLQVEKYIALVYIFLQLIGSLMMSF